MAEPITDKDTRDAYAPIRSPEWAVVYDALRDYRMPNMVYSEDGDAYPLVDLMTRDGETIADGEEVMVDLSDEIVGALRDAGLSPAAPVAVAEGWQLVPMEPTPEMALAAYNRIAICTPDGTWRLPIVDARRAYRAMLEACAAAPAPQPAQQGWRQHPALRRVDLCDGRFEPAMLNGADDELTGREIKVVARSHGFEIALKVEGVEDWGDHGEFSRALSDLDPASDLDDGSMLVGAWDTEDADIVLAYAKPLPAPPSPAQAQDAEGGRNG